MSYVVLRGGGDLATGVALRLYRAGLIVIITELARPLAVRRTVCFSEAVYEGSWTVEGFTATRTATLADAIALADAGGIPVLVAPSLVSLFARSIDVLVDARLIKQAPETDRSVAPLVIGLGPGFIAGHDCHAVVETMRGHTLGRVYWSGSALPDTATPEGDPRRVLRAPADGEVVPHAEIGDTVGPDQVVAHVGGESVACPFGGILRGLIRPGAVVSRGTKIGDIDPRGSRDHCFLVSDKALAIGGGVLEAILTRASLRPRS
ncbi:MAG: selenium-dependent molybdenum cofactor biosynthesis protein YqeB [Acidobacteria bacterium]|nr:selenium-dependent molybdenum cofactor biosynthesis protein YqeB [Acidobacteriota bacterium]